MKPREHTAPTTARKPASPQPARIGERVNVRATFNALVLTLAGERKPRIELNQGELEMATLCAISLFHDHATHGHLTESITNWSWLPAGLDLKNNRLIEDCHGELVKAEFVPHFRLVAGPGDDWSRPSLVALGTGQGGASFPFGKLFGADVARGIARYICKQMDQHPDATHWRHWAGGEKRNWQLFASTRK